MSDVPTAASGASDSGAATSERVSTSTDGGASAAGAGAGSGAGHVATTGGDDTAINAVLADDAEFRAEARAEGFDAASEAAALADIFGDTAAREVSAAKLGGRWASTEAKWTAWERQPKAALGSAIAKVVDDLDAPHLKPSGILERLRSGVDAAAFGLATLCSNLASPVDSGSPAAAADDELK